MNITDTKALIKKLLNAPEKERFVLCLKGHQGIGKTQAIQQVAEENGWNYKALYGAQTQVEDLMGIPYLKENDAIKENNEGEKISKFAKPILFPDKPKTIFVLEEINRAPLDVQQAILQLLTENKFAGRELPQDTVIIVSINPSDVNSGYNVEELDPVFINRICMIDVEPNLNEWLHYASVKKFNKRIIGFLSTPKNNRFFCKKPNYENIGQSLPSPRTWEIVSKILKIENEKTTFLDNLLKGVIGQEATIEFLKDWEDVYIDGKDILTAQYDQYNALKDNELKKQAVSQDAYSLTSLKEYIESQNYELSSEQKVRVMDFINFLHKEKEDRQKIINFFIGFFTYVKFVHTIADIKNECDNEYDKNEENFKAIEEGEMETYSNEYKEYKYKKILCKDIEKILLEIDTNEQ